MGYDCPHCGQDLRLPADAYARLLGLEYELKKLVPGFILKRPPAQGGQRPQLEQQAAPPDPSVEGARQPMGGPDSTMDEIRPDTLKAQRDVLVAELTLLRAVAEAAKIGVDCAAWECPRCKRTIRDALARLEKSRG